MSGEQGRRATVPADERRALHRFLSPRAATARAGGRRRAAAAQPRRQRRGRADGGAARLRGRADGSKAHLPAQAGSSEARLGGRMARHGGTDDSEVRRRATAALACRQRRGAAGQTADGDEAPRRGQAGSSKARLGLGTMGRIGSQIRIR